MPYPTRLTHRQRLHTWLADRILWLQYPQVRPIRVPERAPVFKHAMPGEVRIGLLSFGVVVVLACTAALVLMGVCLWALIRPLFG